MKYQLFRYPNVEGAYDASLRQSVNEFEDLTDAQLAANQDLKMTVENTGELWWVNRFQSGHHPQTYIAVLPADAQPIASYTYLIEETDAEPDA